MNCEFLTSYAGEIPDEMILRAQENVEQSIRMVNGSFAENSYSNTGGVSALLRSGNALSFSAGAGFGKDMVQKVIEEAKKNAVHLSSATAIPPLMSVNCPEAERVDQVLQKEIKELLAEIDTYITEHCKQVKSRFLDAFHFSTERELLIRNGLPVRTVFNRTVVFVTFIGETAEREEVSVDTVLGGAGLFSDLFTDRKMMYEEIDRLYEALLKKRLCVNASSGNKICILAPDPACMLVHEAIGHACESDLVMGGAVTSRHLGEMVASPLVTLGDFARDMRGLPVPQPIWIDDEGVEARDAVLIQDGVLTGYMHDRDSAAHYGVTPTGNARAFTFRDAPLIRMRNTAILPGSSTLEEMISSVEDGYYMVRAGMGQADTSGGFNFAIVEGYEIKNGMIGHAIRDTMCSGQAFDVMQSVEMVGNKVGWDISGLCSKGQPMVTAAGSPHLKCRLKVGGV